MNRWTSKSRLSNVNTIVSSITFAHYVFHFFEDRVLNGEPDRLSNWMENAELSFADLPRRVCQAVTGAGKFRMNCNAAQLELVIEDDTCERD
ncbi:unnamed protein product [marine sediment metagenome]|uniref:Uncharacterized protein n=1 Tax=marine sediment metagenome TaxID=412755 RepID=X0Z8T0_9ZZZZ